MGRTNFAKNIYKNDIIHINHIKDKPKSINIKYIMLQLNIVVNQNVVLSDAIFFNILILDLD